MSPIELYRASELPASYWDRWSETQLENPALASPQFRPEWVQILAQVQPDIEVGIIRPGGKPAAFFPFQRTRSAAAGPVGGVLTDIHGIIAPANMRIDFRQLLAGCRLRSWRFDHVPVDQCWLRPYQLEIDPAPVVDLSYGFEAYWNEKQHSHKSWCKQLQRKERKLARDVGPVRFEPHSTAPEALGQLLKWKSQQLSETGMRNPYHEAPTRAILESVVSCETDYFTGCLSALYAGDRLVAALLGQKSGKHLNAWIPSYDVDYAQYSPGAILHMHLARSMADEGITRIELGRGMNPLKRVLGSWDSPLAIGSADTRRIGKLVSGIVHHVRFQMKQSSFLVQSVRLCRRLRGRAIWH